MPRILTGITPSGTLHIGNYFGAMRPAIELQAGGDAFYFIADYHSMTVITDPKERRDYTLGIALDWLACGLDPAKAVFWRQSDIPEVCELTWMLGSLTPMGLLERAHSYKDKLAKGIAPNFGLFSYPVLMAADILLFDTNVVPVGKDQKQHLEMTRDIAIKFNLTYGETFVVPEERISEEVAVIPGLDGQKMSKSYGNTIDLSDDADTVRKKVMQMYTDPKRVRADIPGTVEGNPVFEYHSAFNPDTAEVDDLKARYRAGKVGDVEVKTKLAKALNTHLDPIRARRADVLAKPSALRDILYEGSRKARTIAQESMERVRDAVKLRYR
jgi:tryptophanyl-tRNA synthetase